MIVPATNCWGSEDVMTRNRGILGTDCRFRGALHLREDQRRRECEPRWRRIEKERRNQTRVVADGEARTAGARGEPPGEARRGEVAPPP